MYVVECSQCDEIRNFEKRLLQTEIFASSPTRLWYVGLNSKKSPFDGRVYAVLGRHLSEDDAKYSLGALTDEETLDFRDVNVRVRTAIMKEFGTRDVKRIQNFMKNDAAHSPHPDFDFMPVYDESPYGDNTLLKSHSKDEDIPLDVQLSLKLRLSKYF